MTETPRPIVIGNWKMNGLAASVAEIELMRHELADHPAAGDVGICPPATLIAAFSSRFVGSAIAIGAQDCHAMASGAHTGDISAAMVRDAGGSLAIVGHSERRQDHGETDTMVRGKAEAALGEGLIAVVCIGETEAQRDAGETLAVLSAQMAGSLPENAAAATVVLAYEPVWAIGTGRTPTTDQIGEAHAHMRGWLTERFGAEGSGMRILYGGSVKPGNAAEIAAVDHVNGALVGGASLKAADFLPIVRAWG